MNNTRNRAKQSLCLGLVMLLSFFLFGCNQDAAAPESNAKILTQLGIEEDGENLLAVLINEPKAEQLSAFGNVTVVTQDENAEEMLIVPLAEGSVIRVEQIIWSHAQQGFISGRVIYTSEAAASGDALHLQAIRPEGMPQLRVLVHSGDQTAEYLVSYNGKEGTPELERLEATAEAGLAWEGQAAGTPATDPEAGQDQAAGEIFKYDEVSHIFNMTEADIIGLYGQPTERRSEEFFEGISFPHLYYDGTEFALDNETGGIVFQAIIKDDRLPAPRGVLIGDTVDSLMAKFPNEKRTDYIQDGSDPTRKEQILYGNGSYMTDYGKVLYQNDQPIEVIYATQDGVALEFFIENNLIHRVMYSIPMT